MQQELILSGTVVSMKDCIYKPDIFEMEDETARQIAQRLLDKTPCPNINSLLEQVKSRFDFPCPQCSQKAFSRRVYIIFLS